MDPAQVTQAVKAFDWSLLVVPAMTALSALGGVWVTQRGNQRLKLVELDYQRKEAKLKRAHDSVEKYLTKLTEVNSIVMNIDRKTDFLRIWDYLLDRIRLTIAASEGQEFFIRHAVSQLDELKEELAKLAGLEEEFDKVGNLLVIELSSLVVLFGDSVKVSQMKDTAVVFYGAVKFNYSRVQTSARQLGEIPYQVVDSEGNISALPVPSLESIRLLKDEIKEYNDSFYTFKMHLLSITSEISQEVASSMVGD